MAQSQIPSEIKEFIEKYVDLIENGDFTALYNQVEDSPVLPSDLTQALLDAEVDPLQYFKQEVPKSYAFMNSIEEAKIPEGITAIGTKAFYGCKKLFSVSLPSTLESIRSEAFAKCSTLESINFPDKIYYIGTNAFEFCDRLKSIILPENLTEILTGTFGFCSSLESIQFGSHLQKIKTSAFTNCFSLTKITFPDSVEEISINAFNDCRNLKEISFLGSVPPQMGTMAFYDSSVATIYFKGSKTTWANNANAKAFDSKYDLRCICSDGEVILDSSGVWSILP